MEILLRDVQHLMFGEYERASNKFGAINHSDHESYSVIKEELEESGDEYSAVKEALQLFWDMVKSDDADDSGKCAVLNALEARALLAACEFIQVAAMAYKAQKTIRMTRLDN